MEITSFIGIAGHAHIAGVGEGGSEFLADETVEAGVAGAGTLEGHALTAETGDAASLCRGGGDGRALYARHGRDVENGVVFQGDVQAGGQYIIKVCLKTL